jgi:hypothetical protein
VALSFDPEQFDDANQARLGEIAGVTVGSVESVEEALLRKGPVPFIGTLYEGGKSDEGRQVASMKDQRLRVKLSVVIVAESWRSREGGRIGALKLIKDVKNKIVTRGSLWGEWVNPQADSPFIYVEDNFMQREGQRVAYQVDFYTYANDDFNS